MSVRLAEVLAVRKRFGDEWTDVREFVRPHDFMVQDLVASRRDWTVMRAWRWVTREIRYPPGNPLTLDLHRLQAFTSRVPLLGALVPGVSYSTIEFWEFPAETLRDRMADCEGSAALLASMLRALYPTLAVHATVGWFEDFGHVWVTVEEEGRRRLYDTTLPADELPAAPPFEDEAPAYEPLFRFNDAEVLLEVPELVIPERTRDLGEERRARIRGWYEIVRATGGVSTWRANTSAGT